MIINITVSFQAEQTAMEIGGLHSENRCTCVKLWMFISAVIIMTVLSRTKEFEFWYQIMREGKWEAGRQWALFHVQLPFPESLADAEQMVCNLSCLPARALTQISPSTLDIALLRGFIYCEASVLKCLPFQKSHASRTYMYPTMSSTLSTSYTLLAKIHAYGTLKFHVVCCHFSHNVYRLVCFDHPPTQITINYELRV